MIVLSAFGLLALVLARVGLYGVVSGSVAQRTQEIGVRMALGAPQRRVFAMVLGDGARPVSPDSASRSASPRWSAADGEALSVWRRADRSRYLRHRVGAAVRVALLAWYMPARRATRIDPMTALRCN